jgi:hypothetical protein
MQSHQSWKVVLRAPPLRVDVYHLRRAIDGMGYTRYHPLDGSEWANKDVAWGSVCILDMHDAVAYSLDEAMGIAHAEVQRLLDPMTHSGHVLWSHLKGPQFEVDSSDETKKSVVFVTLLNPKSNTEWMRDNERLIAKNTDPWRHMETVDRQLRVVLRVPPMRADVTHAREAIDSLRSSSSSATMVASGAEWTDPTTATATAAGQTESCLLLSTCVSNDKDWFDEAEHIARSEAEKWLSPLAWTGRVLLPHMRAPTYEVDFCEADRPYYRDYRDTCFITLTALKSDDEWVAGQSFREERERFIQELRSHSRRSGAY